MEKKDIEFLDDLAWDFRAIYDNLNKGKKKFASEDMNKYIKQITYILSRGLLAKYDDELKNISNNTLRHEIDPSYKDIYEYIESMEKILSISIDSLPDCANDPLIKEMQDMVKALKAKYESHFQDTTKVGDAFDPIWHIQANDVKNGENVMGNSVTKIKKQGKSLLGHMIIKAEVTR